MQVGDESTSFNCEHIYAVALTFPFSSIVCLPHLQLALLTFFLSLSQGIHIYQNNSSGINYPVPVLNMYP